MAFSYGWRGPNIVKDGLVLYLDAGSPNSYYSATAGTTWKDISGFGNNGTLTNGPAYTGSNGGAISFDGVDDFTEFAGGSFNYSPGITREISLEMWVYPTGPFSTFLAEPPTTNLGGFIGQGYYDNAIGWGIGMISSSAFTPTRQFQFQVRNFSTIVSIFGGFELNNWYHVVGSFTRNDFSRLYINGALVSSGSSAPLNGLTITPNRNNARLARAGATGQFYSGCRIASSRIYNRALSANEVLQNYNATKTRFGLT